MKSAKVATALASENVDIANERSDTASSRVQWRRRSSDFLYQDAAAVNGSDDPDVLLITETSQRRSRRHSIEAHVICHSDGSRSDLVPACCRSFLKGL